MNMKRVVRGHERGTLLHLPSALLIGLSVLTLPLGAQPSAPLQTARLLAEAREPVRIVCFGDSITGAYYHSGNRRAWPEMLKVALRRLYPRADVKVVNAGVSGNTSAQGLARMEKDVLVDGYKGVRNRKPDLVVVSLAPDDLEVGDEESFIRQVSWMVNWSLPFAGSAWTAAGVDPALVYPSLTRQQRAGSELLRKIVRGHDLDWIAPPSGASITLQDALDPWFDAQVGKGQ